MAYEDEPRADARALDQLETILRYVADELAGWHARALKAEGDLKEAGGAPRGGAGAGAGAGARNAELEQENKQLRVRVEAARTRVSELLSRLTFLEDQAREQPAAGGSGGTR